MNAKIGHLIRQLTMAHPRWTNTQVATEVRRRIPGAKTSPRSVSSTKSRTRSQSRSSAPVQTNEASSACDVGDYRPGPANSAIHTTRSSYREAVLEHLFTGELLRTLWLRGVHAEVLRPFVDDAGYDLVVHANRITRHIQLKSSFWRAKTARQKVHQQLGLKPSGCVVWLRFHEATLQFEEYLWFGNPPGDPLPDLSRFAIARHTKGDASGRKAERPAIRVIPKGRFVSISTMEQLAEKLFGSKARPRDT